MLRTVNYKEKTYEYSYKNDYQDVYKEKTRVNINSKDRTSRTCLKCSEYFISNSKFNRVCYTCREKNKKYC